jgi:hypothetical protein
LRFFKIYWLDNFGRAALRRKLSAATGLAAADEKPNFSRRRRPKSYRRTAAAGARRLGFGLWYSFIYAQLSYFLLVYNFLSIKGQNKNKYYCADLNI